MPNLSRYGAYRMPAEWEPQKSTWIAWPHNKKIGQVSLRVFQMFLQL